MKKILLILSVFLMASLAMAEVVTVSAVGEADIMNGDTATAKLQAVARAKWAALEQASGVKVKSQTIVQNAVLVDEAIKSDVSGVIQDYKVTGEEQDGKVYRVMVNATVVPEKAKLAVGSVARNTSVSVMIPVVFPDRHVEESNVLTETVINQLTSNDMEVTDMASADMANVADIDRAIKNNNYNDMRKEAAMRLSGTVLIGKVDTTATATQGTDIGYGVSLPFNVVTGRLTYRLITQQGSGTKILASGYLSARGMGASLNTATNQMMQNLNDQVSTKLVSIVLENIKGQNSRLVKVKLVGNTTLDDLMALKQVLTYTAWVLDVQDNGKDTLTVKYPEKSLYLATSISSRPVYTVTKLDDYTIEVKKN